MLFFDIGFGIVLVTTWMMFFVITGSKWKFSRTDFSFSSDILHNKVSCFSTLSSSGFILALRNNLPAVGSDTIIKCKRDHLKALLDILGNLHIYLIDTTCAVVLV